MTPDPGLRPVRALLLLALLAAVGGAFAYGLRAPSTPAALTAAQDPDPDLRELLQSLVDGDALTQQAGLDPCPPGLGLGLEIVLPCLGGGPAVPLAAGGTGVPTLLNVYGSWCGPCRDEMPLLVALRERAGGRVALVGVDTQDEPTAALRFAAELGQRWPAVVDDDGLVLREYGAGVPLTVFLDGAGTVVHVQQGAFRSAEQLASLVATHLDVTV